MCKWFCTFVYIRAHCVHTLKWTNDIGLIADLIINPCDFKNCMRLYGNSRHMSRFCKTREKPSNQIF